MSRSYWTCCLLSGHDLASPVRSKEGLTAWWGDRYLPLLLPEVLFLSHWHFSPSHDWRPRRLTFWHRPQEHSLCFSSPGSMLGCPFCDHINADPNGPLPADNLLVAPTSSVRLLCGLVHLCTFISTSGGFFLLYWGNLSWHISFLCQHWSTWLLFNLSTKLSSGIPGRNIFQSSRLESLNTALP